MEGSTNEIVTTHRCRVCKQQRPLEEFRVAGRTKEGYYRTCHGCVVSLTDRRSVRRSAVVSKICKRCGIDKPNAAYGVDNSLRDGLRANCNECRKELGHTYRASWSKERREADYARTAQWRKENTEAYRASYSKSNRKTKYGLTEEEYRTTLTEQGNVCAICRKPETVVSKYGNVVSFAIDHNHTTGQMRGLLCRACNQGLGHFSDSAELLEAALAYLRHHSTAAVVSNAKFMEV